MRHDLVRFNSPDETANYYFAERIASGEAPKLVDSLNGIAENSIHPRSTQVVNGAIVPGGFLGLPVFYGAIGYVFSRNVLPYLTPLVAVLGLLAFASVVRRLLGSSLSFITFVLAVAHPAVWYYATRGFFHNMLFVSLLCLAWWAYWKAREQAWSPRWLAFGVLMLAAALFTRTSEVLWIAVIVAATVWRHRRDWGIPQWVALLLTGSVIVVAISWVAISVWSQFVPPSYVGDGPSGAVAATSVLRQAWHLLLPFGLHFGSALRHAWQYCFAIFPVYTVHVIIGGVVAWQQRRLPKWYWTLAALVPTWLILYYGSWTIRDTVGPEQMTIGISYVRYWLPIYLLWLPMAAVGVETLVRQLISQRQSLGLAIGGLLLAFIGFQQVYFEPVEGLAPIAERLALYRATSRQVQELTSSDAIIVGDRSDKVFFPERRVIVMDTRPVLDIPQVQLALPRLADVVPLYYQGTQSPSDPAPEFFTAQRFALVNPVALSDGTWLYRLIRP